MEEEILLSINQTNCAHWKSRKYIERTFDILNGFEIIAVKCLSCDKTLELRIKKL